MARTTNDLNAVRQLLGPAIMYSANTVIFTVAALPFMLRISPKLTLFAFLPLPFASVLVQLMGRRIHSRFERIQAMFSDISAKAQENFSGARLIRAFAQEDAEIASFEVANQEYIGRSLYLVRLMAMLWPTLEFILGVSIAVTLFVGGRETVLHHITPGQFTSYMVFMVQLTFPMLALGYVVNLVQRGTASVIRIDELLKQQPSIKDESTSAETDLTPRGEIEFRNLTYSYGQGGNVLTNINLTIPAGSSLVILGPTGSGKTTLVEFIPRLLDADPGTVLLDGVPIREWPLEALRRSIGFVPQETFLFSSTVRDNIAFGVDNATDDQVLEAAKNRPDCQRNSRIPKRFCHYRRRTRYHPLRWPEAAHLHRTCPRPQSPHPHPRRRPRLRRHPHRRAHPAGSAHRHERSHHDPHCPSRLYRTHRRPHRRPCRWTASGVRHPRRLTRRKRLLC